MLQFVFCVPPVHNVSGTPGCSKMTVVDRYGIICDDDFADFGDAKNFPKNYELKARQTHVRPQKTPKH